MPKKYNIVVAAEMTCWGNLEVEADSLEEAIGKVTDDTVIDAVELDCDSPNGERIITVEQSETEDGSIPSAPEACDPDKDVGHNVVILVERSIHEKHGDELRALLDKWREEEAANG